VPEIITPTLLITSVSIGVAGSAAFCLFERIIAAVRPVLVACSVDADGSQDLK